MDSITLLVISNPRYQFLRFLNDLPQPVTVITSDNLEVLQQHAPEAEVILNGFHDGSKLQAILPLAERLRWVHALSAGVEKVLTPELIASPVPLTNGRGVFGPSLAEFAIAAMLFFAKDLRRLVRQQEASRWEQFDNHFLREQTLGVVGYGGIGQETARLAHALGMKVLATRRRAPSEGSDPLVERSFAREQLHEMLGLSDFVFTALPLTDETRGMLGQAEFHAMKPSAVFINVGRGAVVVEEALIAALNEAVIRGAALDVFETEPLPPDHAFYRMENVLLSPHCADHTVGWMELAVKQFIRNFERFRDGQPLEYIVDKGAGY
ncbi:MAG TPA: D-2-hydroxyacid dehydrogenase [Bryobacteraceae bacterium]|nr:D-2-hydroxyacid dehydrogenase [Bryobacteraceae bacterium]